MDDSTDRSVAGSGGGPAVGSVIGGRFVVERVLGRGPTGVVVAAHHKELKTKLAVKLGLTTARESAALFLREAQAMKRLQGPHSVRILEVGSTLEGLPWMAMEYLDGKSLETVLAERGSVNADDALRWMVQLADALVEAHAEGIVHRSVRPSNLFLARPSLGSSAPPTIRLLDAGLSPAFGGLLGFDDRTSSRPGADPAIAFLAPEQIRGAAVDARADVWAFGACLFRLLGGRPPFEGPRLADVTRSILEDPPPALTSPSRDLPRSVDALVQGCLEKEPSLRPDMSAVAVAIRGARDDLRSTPIVVAVGKKLPGGWLDGAMEAVRSHDTDLRETPRGGMVASSSETMTVVKSDEELADVATILSGTRLAPPSLSQRVEDDATLDVGLFDVVYPSPPSSPDTTRFSSAPTDRAVLGEGNDTWVGSAAPAAPPTDDARPLVDEKEEYGGAQQGGSSPHLDDATLSQLAQRVENVPLRLATPGDASKRWVHRPEASHVAGVAGGVADAASDRSAGSVPPSIEPEESLSVPSPDPQASAGHRPMSDGDLTMSVLSGEVESAAAPTMPVPTTSSRGTNADARASRPAMGQPGPRLTPVPPLFAFESARRLGFSSDHARAPMPALHDYQPRGGRRWQVIGLVAIAMAVFGGASWVFHRRGAPVDPAAESHAATSRVTAAPPSPEGTETAPPGAPTIDEMPSDMEPPSQRAASRSGAGATSTSAGVVDARGSPEPARPKVKPRPPPPARETPPVSPPPPPRSGPPAVTPTSSILDKRK